MCLISLGHLAKIQQTNKLINFYYILLGTSIAVKKSYHILMEK